MDTLYAMTDILMFLFLGIWVLNGIALFFAILGAIKSSYCK